MKSILLSFAILSLSSSLFAKFPVVSVKDLSGEFENNRGKAYAESAKYDLTEAIISHDRINVEFFKPKKNLVLRDDSTVVELNFDVSFMNIFKAFQADLVNINSTEETFSLTTEKLVLDIAPTKYTFNKVELETDVKGKVGKDQEFDLIDGFLISGEANVKSVYFGILSREDFIKELKLENPEHAKEIDTQFEQADKIPVVARNFRLVVEKGNFSGSVYLDSWLNATLYLGGKVEYPKADGVLIIKLWKAKVGYFSIRNLILSRIAALDLEAVTVKGSTITIDLGKTSRR